MFTSEKAYDMLPHAVDIYDKLDIDSYRKQIAKKYENQDNIDRKEVGIEVIKYIIKNTPKIKEEVFSIVAIVEGKSLDEVKNQPPIRTIKTFKEVFEDNELIDFFSSAMQ